jgi:YVTN family beta-propeller protein
MFQAMSILWLGLTALAGGGLPAVHQGFEQAGIAVDFTLTPLGSGEGSPAAGERALATFRVSDAHGGQALTGLHPLAWMTATRASHLESEAACRAKAKSLLDASLANRADVNLNGYLLLTLNGDKTVSFINPQVTFNQTQLESIVELPAPGAGWTLTAEGDALYVTLPSAGAVAVIDTATRKLIATIPLGDGTLPTRISLQPDGRYAWIALDGATAVVAIDTRSRKVAARIAVGAGEHDFAFTDDSRFAYVTNSDAGSVSAIDIATLARRANIAVGRRPLAITYGEKSRQIYVAAADDTAIAVIDPDKQQVVGRIPVQPGVVALRFDPEGRFALAVNQRESTVTVLDSATNTALVSGPVPSEPDEVAFSGGYAYVRSLGSATFTLFGLAELRQGRLSPVKVQAGSQPPNAAPEAQGPAAMIAPTPEGNSVLIANAAEKMAFYYVEGMMVPMGTLQMYGRQPRGLLVLDHSLREVEPGVYATTVSLPRSGGFDVPLLIDQPRLIHCFTATIAPQTGEVKAKPIRAVAIQPLFSGARLTAKKPAELSFRIVDAVTRQPIAGLRDVRLLAVEPPGIWQQRKWARDSGNGEYRVDWIFPHAGVYQVGVSVASRSLGFADLPFTTVLVEDLSGKKRGAR